MKFERLVICSADKVDARRRARVAEGLPETVWPKPAQRERVDIQQPRSVAGEAVCSVVQNDRAAVVAGEIPGRDRAGESRCVRALGKDGIRRWRQLLARGEIRETPAAVGPHADLQPVSRAGEHTHAKVNRHGEQTVVDGDTIGRNRPVEGYAAAADIEQRERQVIGAIGRIGVVIQLALIGERCALGKEGIASSEQAV